MIAHQPGRAVPAPAPAAAPLRIAFFGSSLLSAYWNGAATYYRGIIRALHQRGHRITFYEPDALDRQRHRDIDPPDWAGVVVYPARTERAILDTIELAADVDVVIKASGVGVHDGLLEAAVLALRRPDQAVIFWDVDAPATLSRVEHDPQDPFRKLIPRYDLVLTYGGGDPVVQRYTALGARACVPIYNALDPDTHFRVDPEPRFSADLAFLGNRLPDREARVQEFFLRPAELLPERRFILGGAGWDDKPRPPNVEYLGHVYTRDHNAINSSPTAVLNISRDSMAQAGFSPATRIFEAAGAGACIITDHWQGIELFLEPGTEILVARDGHEVARHLKNLDLPTAAAIGDRARRRILRQHTYAHRAAQLESILTGSHAPNPSPGRFHNRQHPPDHDDDAPSRARTSARHSAFTAPPPPRSPRFPN